MSTDSTPPTPGHILVVDDQRNMRTVTALVLRTEGYTVSEAATGQEALDFLTSNRVDVLLTDLKMEPMNGLSLLKKALEAVPQLQVIVMTAFGSIDSAVEAMRLGAYDYISKPFKEGVLHHRVALALERSRLLAQVNLLQDEFNQRHNLRALVGTSPAMRELKSRLLRVARSDATVLIQGESGTGKELVARALHAHSRRSLKPFVPVNCDAISESLLEADGGTCFIDEVTETSPAFQSKLLRALQEGEVRRVGESASVWVDVRIVAATSRDIEQEVQEKRFRQGLYYLLNVVKLRVPPLRERLEDVHDLARHFLERANARNAQPKRLSGAAVAHLMGYTFPGNARELRSLVERAAAMAEGDELLPADFPLPGKTDAPSGRATRAAGRRRHR